MEKEGNNLFQVNLKGMIALLSEHIYSNPNTFVRELLQNCVDAITALRNIDENYKGRIDVFLNEDKTVVFRDNGVGLKEEEVYRFLTVIGESSKRDTPDADDFIGRFGIGLLSCFVVTNEITVESRSAMGGQPVCWCGKVDGTYQLTLSDEERPIGSQVVLHPKGDWMHLFEYETFKKILVSYGEVLPYPIYLHYQGDAQPMSNAEFVATFSQERNRGFNTAVGTTEVSDRNTIPACVHGAHGVMDGQTVRLRLLEPMAVAGRIIPRNAVVVGTGKIQGERLDIEVTSLEYDGTIIPVELAVYDTDGQPGIFIPNSMEMNAVREVAANMGGSLGSSINISTNAGAQLASDLGKGLIQGTSQYIAKKMRTVKVHLKAGYRVMLYQEKD